MMAVIALDTEVVCFGNGSRKSIFLSCMWYHSPRWSLPAMLVPSGMD